MSLLALLRCGHKQLSRIFTIGGKTYQVCLDCGAELEYDLTAMRPTGKQLAASLGAASKRRSQCATLQPLTSRRKSS
jgi:hypothetical protein